MVSWVSENSSQLIQAVRPRPGHIVSMTRREPTLLEWQWRGYPEFHADRRNLLVHVLTQPIFVAAMCLALSAPFHASIIAIVGSAMAGVLAMIVVVAVQGRGHAREHNLPIPFAGPLDVIGRIFAEQLITFPRFVLSGGFARAWRAAGREG